MSIKATIQETPFTSYVIGHLIRASHYMLTLTQTRAELGNPFAHACILRLHMKMPIATSGIKSPSNEYLEKYAPGRRRGSTEQIREDMENEGRERKKKYGSRKLYNTTRLTQLSQRLTSRIFRQSPTLPNHIPQRQRHD